MLLRNFWLDRMLFTHDKINCHNDHLSKLFCVGWSLKPASNKHWQNVSRTLVLWSKSSCIRHGGQRFESRRRQTYFSPWLITKFRSLGPWIITCRFYLMVYHVTSVSGVSEKQTMSCIRTLCHMTKTALKMTKYLTENVNFDTWSCCGNHSSAKSFGNSKLFEKKHQTSPQVCKIGKKLCAMSCVPWVDYSLKGERSGYIEERFRFQAILQHFRILHVCAIRNTNLRWWKKRQSTRTAHI